LICIGSHFQLEWLRSRNDGIRLEQFGSTETVLSLANSINTSLIDTNEVVCVAHAARRASEFGYVCSCLHWFSVEFYVSCCSDDFS